MHKRVTSDYSTITPAFDEVITAAAESEIIESISAERLDETINETVNESVNLTVEENRTPSKGLAEISGQSIDRN